GGGINDLGAGKLSVADDTFSNNSAPGTGSQGDGGAIDVGDLCESAAAGDLVVTDSSFIDNSAGVDGGAIDAENTCSGPGNTGTLTVTGSTFQGNTTTSGVGGAISQWNSAAGSSVTNSTFDANSAGDSGGAIGGPGDVSS